MVPQRQGGAKGGAQAGTQTRNGDPQPLLAENVLPLRELRLELKGAFSGLTDQERAELARALGIDEEDIAEYLATQNVENLIQAGFNAATERLGADTSFVPDDPDVVQAVERLNRQANGIARTTQKRMNGSIREGLAENEGVEQIKARVTQSLRDMADGGGDAGQARARRIASTTTTTAFEKGQDKAFQEVGIYGRMWLSQRDVHVRRGHLDADGQQREMGEPFSVAPGSGSPGEALEFPGDPEGSPANIINCRCTTLPIPDQETYEEMQSESPDLSNLPQLS